MSLQELQAVVDRSLANASPLARALFGRSHFDATAIEAFVNRVGSATIATVRRDGRPHAAWTLACCAGGVIYFAAADGSVLLRTLRANDAVALTVTEQDHGLMADGRARILGRRSELPELMPALDTASSRGRFVDKDWDGSEWNGWICAVDLERVFAS
ncbi:MAG TPA: pyridoxamine 5'-phosphate oxidase family protein [Dehalococcoidia bacterium]|nr:pyridoxamine 5'-phosphate oxidase family protein [Dehalococcoidia bacterium]